MGPDNTMSQPLINAVVASWLLVAPFVSTCHPISIHSLQGTPCWWTTTGGRKKAQAYNILGALNKGKKVASKLYFKNSLDLSTSEAKMLMKIHVCPNQNPLFVPSQWHIVSAFPEQKWAFCYWVAVALGPLCIHNKMLGWPAICLLPLFLLCGKPMRM